MVALEPDKDSDQGAEGGKRGTTTWASFRRWHGLRYVLAATQGICGVLLLLDVGGEIHFRVVSDDGPETFSLSHLVSEVFATLLMFGAFMLSLRQVLHSRREVRLVEQRLQRVRGDFSDLVNLRFRTWGLSPAETEIALLTIKGLRIAEIARLRDSREGTVKSHLGAIFRKAGVASRTELLAKFVDDFLDHSSKS